MQLVLVQAGDPLQQDLSLRQQLDLHHPPVLAALGVFCGIVHHGIEGLCHTREKVVAASVVQTVIGAGLIAWALLLMLVVVM